MILDAEAGGEAAATGGGVKSAGRFEGEDVVWAADGGGPGEEAGRSGREQARRDADVMG
ncbi:MAG: hypothetical protein IPK53_08855 [bacterium]|nr:hypothetical protein [bacterium]